MNNSPIELLRGMFSDPDLFQCALWVILPLLTLSAVLGTAALLRSRGVFRQARDLPAARRDAEYARLARWTHLPVALGLLALLVTVIALAYHQAGKYEALESKGPNATPWDYWGVNLGTSLALFWGALIGLVGIVTGWTLGWMLESRWIAALRKGDAEA